MLSNKQIRHLIKVCIQVNLFIVFYILFTIVVSGVVYAQKPNAETKLDYKQEESVRKNVQESIQKETTYLQESSSYHYEIPNTKNEQIESASNQEEKSKAIMDHVDEWSKEVIQKVRNKESEIYSKIQSYSILKSKEVREKLKANACEKEPVPIKEEENVVISQEKFHEWYSDNTDQKCLLSGKIRNKDTRIEEHHREYGVFCAVEKQNRWRVRKMTLF